MGPIERDLQFIILNRLNPGKVLIISGAQGVGKTHLLKDISRYYEGICLYLNAEEHQVKKLLLGRDSQKYREYINNKLILLIDDADYLPKLEEVLQAIRNTTPNLKIIISTTFQPNLQGLDNMRLDYTLYALTH